MSETKIEWMDMTWNPTTGCSKASAECKLGSIHIKSMSSRRTKRLPNYDGVYPVWLWLDKPDMGQSGHFSRGTECVRLTLRMNEQEVFVSDFEDWHFVLNNGFCSDSEEEDRLFELGRLSITKEESWLRIFGLDRQRDPEWHGTAERKLQGVTGKIELSQVKKMKYFIAR